MTEKDPDVSRDRHSVRVRIRGARIKRQHPQNEAFHLRAEGLLLRDGYTTCAPCEFATPWPAKNHDRIDSVKGMLNNMEFNGSESHNQVFSFGLEMDTEGILVVGNGSNQQPFIAGITTKALLLRLDRPAASFVFHIDAPYKTNHCYYTVVVVSISDSSRVSSIVSQETEPVFETALLALKRIFGWVSQKELRVEDALADADQAQNNALLKTFGDYGNFQFLIKVHKAIRGFPSGVAGMIVRDLYDKESW
ncbi:hypothetical protein PHMEG_0005545 [Phytophthora megakarya]|uniref:MULE transposase domain-containing protein n=1 Tax=Phytophthora megakarya TaxID=4795 RepID=A0A225WSM7_9STRA|nr:hypothetical protein PHMEG_0005545 [Phytophthora megakarya]